MSSAHDQHARSDDEHAVERAVAALRAGGMIVVADDEDRENEGDLIVAAEKVTEEQLTFVIRHTSGIVCTPMTDDRADALGLEPMVKANSDPHGTAFTVSVDHLSAGTGVSTADRRATVRALADGTTRPEELRRPGHIFPLRARPGGVLRRAGHTEAAVDLLGLAGLTPVGVISELVDDRGRMLAGKGLVTFADAHGLPFVTIEELIRYRRRRSSLVTAIGEAQIPTFLGEFRAVAYRAEGDSAEHLALVYGDLGSRDAPIVRVHSECLTGDVIGSLRCDCGDQVQTAMRMIADAGAGVVVYLRGHEGRGIGLGHKLRAYALQQRGYDTVDANQLLGFPADAREYGIGAAILSDLGVSRLRLLTNNPQKYGGIEAHGLEIVERIGMPPSVTDENIEYLRTKRDRCGHLIGRLSVS